LLYITAFSQVIISINLSILLIKNIRITVCDGDGALAKSVDRNDRRHRGHLRLLLLRGKVVGLFLHQKQEEITFRSSSQTRKILCQKAKKRYGKHLSII